jgi:nucleoside-diphosphate-sugar epimerase
MPVPFDFESNERVLVTGGAGFIGSQITRQLREHDVEVIIYDNFTQYTSPLNSTYQHCLKARFEGLTEQIEIVRGDTRDREQLRRMVLEYRPTRIIHLAGLPLANLSKSLSEEAYGTIVTGTVNLLEVSRELPDLRRFVYTSSSMVYGDFQQEPCPEDHPKNPKQVYGGCKYAGEVMVETYGKQFKIPYSIVRPSAVYGPTDVNRRVVQLFVENAVMGRPLILHNGGTGTLDFTHVNDIAQGFILAAFHENAVGQAFNMTRGQGRSLKEMADIIKKLIPEAEVIEKPYQDERPKRGSLDITKARSLLGYDPQFTLETGVADYMAFVQEHSDWYKFDPISMEGDFSA